MPDCPLVTSVPTHYDTMTLYTMTLWHYDNIMTLSADTPETFYDYLPFNIWNGSREKVQWVRCWDVAYNIVFAFNSEYLMHNCLAETANIMKLLSEKGNVLIVWRSNLARQRFIFRIVVFLCTLEIYENFVICNAICSSEYLANTKIDNWRSVLGSCLRFTTIHQNVAWRTSEPVYAQHQSRSECM